MVSSDLVRPTERSGPATPGERRRRGAIVLFAGLCAGMALALARALLLVRVERRLWNLREPLVEWRVSRVLAGEYPLAIVCGVLAVVGLYHGLPRRGWPRGLAVLAAVLVAALVLVGPPWSSGLHALLEPALARSWRALALGGLILTASAALVLGVLLLLRRRRVPSFAVPLCAGAWLVAIAFPPLYRRLAAPGTPTMLAREVALELVLTPEAWRIESQRPDAPPHAGVLAPCTDYRVDGADLPALVMPPPCTLSFTVPATEELVWLRIAAGVPEEVTKVLKARRARTFGFAVERNGERLLEAKIEAHDDLEREVRTWRRPARGALELAGGDEIRLSTWIEGEPPETSLAGPAYEVGFGDVVLEKRRTRERRPSSAATPNLVLVLQDTLRSDRLSSYEYGKPTTPHVDRLAARGMRFERAFSTASWTWPSTASILTGLHPDRHGVTDDSACYLAGANETVAEALQARGYTTAAFTSNPLITPQKNFDQGFETFDYMPDGFRKTDELLPVLLRWLDQHSGVRFFLYLHLVDPHHPHEPRPEDLARLGETEAPDWGGDSSFQGINTQLLHGKGHDEQGLPIPDFVSPESLARWNDLYDASVATGDHYLGAILDRLEWLGLDDETVVVFTSDHGEEWLDHGLLAHGQSVHRELVQVPLVLAGPGIPRDVTSERIVSNRQIAPTLAHFGGAHLASVDDPIDLADLSRTEDSTMYFATTHGWWNRPRERQPIYGMREGRWVLHYAPHGADWKVPRKDAPPGGQIRLYDVETDPQEQVDVAEAHPEIATAMKARLLAHLEAQVAERPSASLGAGSATLQMLQGIGYLGTDEKDEAPASDGERGGQ